MLRVDYIDNFKTKVLDAICDLSADAKYKNLLFRAS